jgi:PDZ domain-containing protein
MPYYTISPGDAVNLYTRVDINGAEQYDPNGEMLLLFVRQRARVSVFRYIQARLDPDIDLFPEEEVTGGRTPQQIDLESNADMLRAQLEAKKVALEAAGYEVKVGDGVDVLLTMPGAAADGTLEPGDRLLAVDGEPVTSTNLGELVLAHEPGDAVTLTVERDGEELEVPIELGEAEDGTPLIGIYLAPIYDFPVDVEIDTSNIGGPSAGLAMTLSVIDELTPGDLTGDQSVAVTGTIDGDGNVGPIGGISQKAVAARKHGAELFLVPACPEGDNPCHDELARAIDRAGDDLPVIPVATLDEALAALEEHGGEPLEEVRASA